MHTLARAVILATQYLAKRDDGCSEDDDMRKLEEIAQVLSQATPSEKGALIDVTRELGLPEWPHQIGID
jgi:hypothetical protein